MKDPEAVIAAGEVAQAAMVEAFEARRGFTTTDRDEAEKIVEEALRGMEKPTAAVRKAVLAVVSRHDPDAPIVANRRGDPEPDLELRDYENVPVGQATEDYMERDVLLFVPDAWSDDSSQKVGAEIPVTRLFHRDKVVRPLEEIDAEIRELETEIQRLTTEVTCSD